MLIKDVNGALVWDLGCAEKQDMKTLKRNQTKLLLWSENVQYQSAVIYENTFSLSISISFPSLSRIDDYILPKDEFYKAPNGPKGKRRFFSFKFCVHNRWENKLFRQMMMAHKKSSIYYTHIYIDVYLLTWSSCEDVKARNEWRKTHPKIMLMRIYSPRNEEISIRHPSKREKEY